VNENGRGGGDVIERIPETKRIKVVSTVKIFDGLFSYFVSSSD
jgi:hypothetical protein